MQKNGLIIKSLKQLQQKKGSEFTSGMSYTTTLVKVISMGPCQPYLFDNRQKNKKIKSYVNKFAS